MNKVIKEKDKIDIYICKFCSQEFSSTGIKNHEKFCSKNPDVIEKEKEKEKQNKNVTLVSNVSGTIKVIGKEYDFSKGSKMEVPKDVGKVLKVFRLAK